MSNRLPCPQEAQQQPADSTLGGLAVVGDGSENPDAAGAQEPLPAPEQAQLEEVVEGAADSMEPAAEDPADAHVSTPRSPVRGRKRNARGHVVGAEDAADPDVRISSPGDGHHRTTDGQQARGGGGFFSRIGRLFGFGGRREDASQQQGADEDALQQQQPFAFPSVGNPDSSTPPKPGAAGEEGAPSSRQKEGGMPSTGRLKRRTSFDNLILDQRPEEANATPGTGRRLRGQAGSAHKADVTPSRRTRPTRSGAKGAEGDDPAAIATAGTDARSGKRETRRKSEVRALTCPAWYQAGLWEPSVPPWCRSPRRRRRRAPPRRPSPRRPPSPPPRGRRRAAAPSQSLPPRPMRPSPRPVQARG